MRALIALALALQVGCVGMGGLNTFGNVTAEKVTGDGVTVTETFMNGELIAVTTNCTSRCKTQRADGRDEGRVLDKVLGVIGGVLIGVMAGGF